MIYRYEGQERFQDWVSDTAQVPGGTVSPGGAAAILRTSRQWIDELIRTNPRVRAWIHYDTPSSRAGYISISVRDLVLYGVERGKLTCPEDSNLGFPGLAEEIARARAALDKSKEALVY